MLEIFYELIRVLASNLLVRTFSFVILGVLLVWTVFASLEVFKESKGLWHKLLALFLVLIATAEATFITAILIWIQ